MRLEREREREKTQFLKLTLLDFLSIKIKVKNRKDEIMNKLGLCFKYIKSDQKNSVVYYVTDCLRQYLA